MKRPGLWCFASFPWNKDAQGKERLVVELLTTRKGNP
jgi:hypothetical protein